MSRDHRCMSLENEALRRCERLLALMSEAMEMERTSGDAAAHADAHTRSLLRPLLEEALARLEGLQRCSSARSLQDWVRELIDLEIELDSVLARRGWRAIAVDDDPPTLLERC
jgi:hypothetical protein